VSDCGWFRNLIVSASLPLYLGFGYGLLTLVIYVQTPILKDQPGKVQRQKTRGFLLGEYLLRVSVRISYQPEQSHPVVYIYSTRGA
jgi:hypothetical protein